MKVLRFCRLLFFFIDILFLFCFEYIELIVDTGFGVFCVWFMLMLYWEVNESVEYCEFVEVGLLVWLFSGLKLFDFECVVLFLLLLFVDWLGWILFCDFGSCLWGVIWFFMGVVRWRVGRGFFDGVG